MKVFMPKPHEDWICDTIIDEFFANSRHSVANNPYDADVVWHYAKWVANRYNNVSKGAIGHKPTVTTVHHIVPGKFQPVDLEYLDTFTDVYHVPNEITAIELAKRTQVPIVRLSYWVNDMKFKPGERKQLGDKLIIGSFQRDTEGAGLIQGQFLPKLEKGPDILCDVLEKLPVSSFRVLLAGWRRQYVMKRLEKIGAEFEFCERVEDVVPLYREIDLYMVTSRYEGGPQALLEAAQMGVRVLSTPVGLAPELLHPDCMCHSISDFVKAVHAGVDRTRENSESVKGYAMGVMVPKYDEFIDEVIIHAKR